jgi:hypothetical protein
VTDKTDKIATGEEPQLTTADAVSRTVAAIGLAMMQETLASGKAIEIPALGIVIQPQTDSEEAGCRPN